ncbi:hypothetical protein [Helicobacter sp. T3_23-1056]
MKKLVVAMVFGIFGFVGVGFGEVAESSLDSSAQTNTQTESNVDSSVDSKADSTLESKDAKDSKVGIQTQEKSTQSAEDSAQASSEQTQTNAESQSSAESKTELSRAELDSQTQDLQAKYPNSDWEVGTEMENSEWSKKSAECSLEDKTEAQREKCKAAQAKRLHSLCKSKGDKYCVLKVALFAGENRLIEDIDILYKSCDNGYGSACTFYGMGVGNMGDKANELRLYEKACELGSAMGCFGVGGIYFEKDKDAKKAKPYIDKAIDLGDMGCQNGFEVACKWLDNVKKVKTEIELQIEALNKPQEADTGKKSKKSKK